MKEGCAINQSLSALGNVISALADKAAGKLKPGQVRSVLNKALTKKNSEVQNKNEAGYH